MRSDVELVDYCRASCYLTGRVRYYRYKICTNVLSDQFIMHLFLREALKNENERKVKILLKFKLKLDDVTSSKIFHALPPQAQHEVYLGTMVTKPTLYLGIGLALLSSNLCLLLLTLNFLGWFNILHADLTFIEQAAETISAKEWQLYCQSAMVAWLVLVLISAVQKRQQQDEKVAVVSDDRKVTKDEKNNSHGASFLKSICIVVFTLLTPHILQSHRHRHPILRRSLVSHQSTPVSKYQHNIGADSYVNTQEEGTIASSITPQELVFSVDNMTCGGCGSHVRNLVESNLNQQQQQQASSMTIDKVAVDWRAGVLSIYGGNLNEFVDQSVIIDMLKKEGYPTSFLYVN